MPYLIIMVYGERDFCLMITLVISRFDKWTQHGDSNLHIYLYLKISTWFVTIEKCSTKHKLKLIQQMNILIGSKFLGGIYWGC